ncbi:hypothetical protein F5878DRAFT_201291 [Lentinula raphanica]|uniref:Secreted protein n=1 Tax=Lentinula raphanica TaxID=153919 RepID=A0AA38P7V4_9AGAR|nr:hypothetical protein F5878DRAFT_201291 [Lentinula raphanica]
MIFIHAILGLFLTLRRMNSSTVRRHRTWKLSHPQLGRCEQFEAGPMIGAGIIGRALTLNVECHFLRLTLAM